uniref:Peptidase A2 domain-containing protein n=1 Tax=Trichuris muris TaxID=70415 RepID=A0A5S6PZA0_TRIMR
MQIAQAAKSPNRRRRYVRNQLLTHKIRDIDDASSQMQSGPDNIASLYTIDSGKVACSPPKTILLHVDGIPLRTEIDSGASRSIISELAYHDILFGRPQLTNASLTIRTWSETTIVIVGVATVTVTYKDSKHKLQLLVAEGAGPSPVG